MSDVMLFGVLRMPYELAMGDELSRRQFYGRAQQAADELEKSRAERRYDVHSCHANCTMAGCVNGRLRAEIASLKAAAAKSERRAITFGDIVATHTIAMGAAVVEGHLTDPAHGLQWIVNTLAGPGHLPDLDEARRLGGAQAWFDAKMAEHEAFRAAHPMPEVK